jgi:hypothetical protein
LHPDLHPAPSLGANLARPNSIHHASYSRLTMLRVYLDQNKWIDLARAANGRLSRSS